MILSCTFPPGALALLALATLAGGQSPCLINLVPNGNFETLQPGRWIASGNQLGIQWLPFTTNGVETSSCYQLTPRGIGPIALTQPTAFPLTGSSPYEFSVDLHGSSFPNATSVDVGITDGAGRTRVASVFVGNGTMRLSAIFSAPRSASFVLDIQMSQPAFGWSRAVCHIDNAEIRPAQLPAMRFASPRVAGSPNSFTIEGPANAVFALFVSASGFSAPVRPAGCQGDWLLMPPAYPVVINGLLSSTGNYSAALSVPAALAGIPLYWQSGQALPLCTLGCPVMIGFP